MAERSDILIIGAGFAGASTAWWLKRRGVDRVKILEMEIIAGAHASGRNAGIARQSVADAATAALTARGGRLLRSLPAGFSETEICTVSGGFLLAPKPEDEGLEIIRRSGVASGVDIYWADRGIVLGSVPVLDGSPFQSALHCPTDGLVDTGGLLQAYLKQTPPLTGCKVESFTRSGKTIASVKTAAGEFTADAFVIAAGAWSAELGKEAGSQWLPLSPRRRHLVHTGMLEWVDASMPYAWFESPEVYFRPESGGLLLSPCDEELMPPCDPPTDREAPVWLYEKLKKAFPKLTKLPVARFWAGLRCFVPDGRFVIGKDPEISNLFWVAALGGHGVTASPAIGELASALITGATPAVDPEPHSPVRFT